MRTNIIMWDLTNVHFQIVVASLPRHTKKNNVPYDEPIIIRHSSTPLHACAEEFLICKYDFMIFTT